jgi:hypothetical protein
MYSALQAAQVVAQAPGAAVMADEIMRGAGFKDQVMQEEQALIQQAAMQRAAQAQAMAQAQQQAQMEQAALAEQQAQADMQAAGAAGDPMPANMTMTNQPEDPSALVGVRQGIKTMRNDGVR